MINRLAILGMLLVVFCANGRAKQIQPHQDGQSPPAPVPAVSQQQPRSAAPGKDEQKKIHADVEIVNPPQKDFYDKAPV